jgi:hypothetical protein
MPASLSRLKWLSVWRWPEGKIRLTAVVWSSRTSRHAGEFEPFEVANLLALA